MKTSYAAKADHLRRMMDRTRNGYRDRGSLGVVYSLLFRLAGIGWMLSIVLQACWHAMAAMSVPQQWSLDEYEESLFTGAPPTPEQCAHQAVNSRKLHKACVAPVTNWMPYIMALGLATLWWNRHVQTIYTRPSAASRTGIRDYYILQVSTFAVRILGWHFLRPDVPQLSGDLLKAGHLFMIMLLALVSWTTLFYICVANFSQTTTISLNAIKLDFSPKVSFTIDESSLLPDVVEKKISNDTLDPSYPLHRKQPYQQIQLNKLAPPSSNIYAQARQAPYQPPAPPSEEGYSDGEAMDWTPSGRPQASSFNPAMTRSTATFSKASTGPSPFHGALPAAPQAPSHRLRKPAALQPGALRKVSESQKENFSASFMGFGLKTNSASQNPSRQQHPHNDPSTDEDTVTEDERGRSRRVGKKRREMEIADPKFWPPEDRTTGLEALFKETLDMADTPTGIREEVVASREDSWMNPFTIGLVPVALGAAVLIVKGGLI